MKAPKKQDLIIQEPLIDQVINQHENLKDMI